MNPEMKTKWVAALRSGEYKQITGFLRYEEGFCCLGVLCDLANSKGWRQNKNAGFTYAATASITHPISLPFEVGHNYGIPNAVMRKLAYMNDEGRDFSEIADYIEESL